MWFGYTISKTPMTKSHLSGTKPLEGVKKVVWILAISFNINKDHAMFVSILFAKKKTLWVLSIQPASPDLLVLPSLPIAGTHLASERLWQHILSLPIRNMASRLPYSTNYWISVTTICPTKLKYIKTANRQNFWTKFLDYYQF